MSSPGAPKCIAFLPEEEQRSRDVGILYVQQGEERVQLPLAGVKLSARVADRVAEVTIEQTFQNPFKEHLEAVYIFPLAGGAAVSAFEMKVGSRIIKGLVKEREEARKTYQKALSDGKRAALLEQERDDVFTVQVGNLPPGEEVTVRITTSERLAFFENGSTELRLPLVVAPRYIPGEPVARDPVGQGTELDTTDVPDASRITPPRLAEGFDPKVRLSIEVGIEGDFADLACSQHAVRLTNGRIALSRENELLNRDFVLRWRLAKDAVHTSLLIHRNNDGRSYGMLTIVPPKRDGFLGLARDVVFILDRSGSMEGIKMTSAAHACSLLLATLGPRDRFAICAFDDTTEWFNHRFGYADEATLTKGDQFLRQIGARGGTQLDPAFDETFAAIRDRQETTGRVPVVVLITDGQVGNESQILKRLQKEIGDARVFTIGIDTAVNEAFLKRLAATGGGTCTCCIPGEALEDALRNVGREIGTPLVTDLRIEGVDNVAPARVPDLFAGRAATAFFAGTHPSRVRIRGTFTDGKTFETTVQAKEVPFPAIAHLWARTRVADLEDRFRLGEDVKKEIVELAVRHTILTRFTAFVVVDESEVVNEKGERRTLVQPVHMPDQWEMNEGGFENCKMSAPVARMWSPMPPPSVSSSQQTGPGFFSKLTGALSKGKMKKTGTKSTSTSDVSCEPAEKCIVTQADRDAVKKAIEALSQALVAARTALTSGVVPVPEPIAKARHALIEALASSDLGTELAELQRFLRSTLLEFIAAVATPGAPPASLLSLLDRIDREWRDVQKPSPQNPFWEATV